MNIISQYLNFSDYNHTILWPAAVLGYLVSYALVSSPTTPTSIPTSTLLSAMSTLTVSTLWWIPFAKVAISTLVLRNVISAPCAPLRSIYMCVAQLLAHISLSLRHPSKLTMADIWYSIQSSPLLGSLVAKSVITSALAQLFQQPLVAYQITSSRLLVQRCISDVYSHSHQYFCGGSKPTHLTGISRISFSFPCYICRVLRDFGSSGPRLAVEGLQSVRHCL